MKRQIDALCISSVNYTPRMSLLDTGALSSDGADVAQPHMWLT